MWRGQHPGAADISLVVQISDSSLSFDLGTAMKSLGDCGSRWDLGFYGGNLADDPDRAVIHCLDSL